VPLVEQELLTFSEHLSSPPVFGRAPVTRSLGLCVCFVDRCLSFCAFPFVLSVLLRYTYADYFVGIFKLFLRTI
jgi:hypothetical protein